MLQVQESNLIKLLIAVGVRTAAKWSRERLQSKLNNLYDSKSDLEKDDLCAEDKALLIKIFRSLKKDLPVVVIDDKSNTMKFLKGDKIIHAKGYVFKVVKPPYLVGPDININVVRLNLDGKSIGDILQKRVADFVCNAVEDDLSNPTKGACLPRKKSKEKEPKKMTTKKAPKEKTEKKKRITIGSTMYEYFDKVGVDKATVAKATQLAVCVKPGSPFNAHHLVWYQNTYRKERGLAPPPRKKRSKNKSTLKKTEQKQETKAIQDEVKKRVAKKKAVKKTSKKTDVKKKTAKKKTSVQKAVANKTARKTRPTNRA